MSGSIAWLGATNTCSLIRSASRTKGLRPIRAASSLTMIGGLMLMQLPVSSSTAGASLGSGATGETEEAGSGAGISTTGAGSASSRSLEMTGSTALPDWLVFLTEGRFFFVVSSKISSALALAASRALGGAGTSGIGCAAVRWRSRREGALAVKSRTWRFGGVLSLSLAIRRVVSSFRSRIAGPGVIEFLKPRPRWPWHG